MGARSAYCGRFVVFFQAEEGIRDSSVTGVQTCALPILIIVFLTLGFVFFPYGVVRELALEAAAGAGFSANILFWLQADYFDGLNGTKPLLHLWSLGVEEQFYLIWPTLMVVAVALGKRGMNILTLLASVAGASFAADIVLT